MPPSSREALRDVFEAIRSAIRMSYPGRGYTMKDVRTALEYGLSRWNERERLEDANRPSDVEEIIMWSTSNYEARRGDNIRETLRKMDDALLGTPTSAAGEAGNPSAEVQARGSDLSPSSVTPRVCRQCDWAYCFKPCAECPAPEQFRVGTPYGRPAISGRALAPAEAQPEPTPAAPAGRVVFWPLTLTAFTFMAIGNVLGRRDMRRRLAAEEKRKWLESPLP